ncbi:MAG: class I SAM-dependent methyltransferase [Planctomycetes bacterium]|nr:class I SAM-dependent methyltransferase [Planctomycetota bacterium]
MYRKRIHDTIQSLNIPADAKVLEIGVGTGISLSAYPPHANVLGVDLSTDMLNQAASRAESEGRSNITLQQMDALDLTAPSEAFDFVMAFHVVSVVGDVDRMMGEMYRVCKPGGKIVVINHFRSPRPLIAAVVDQASPITRRLGWRTTLRLEEVTSAVPLQVEKQYKTSFFSLFTVMIATKPAEQAAGQE